jgi:hypothetical protein
VLKQAGQHNHMVHWLPAWFSSVHTGKCCHQDTGLLHICGVLRLATLTLTICWTLVYPCSQCVVAPSCTASTDQFSLAAMLMHELACYHATYDVQCGPGVGSGCFAVVACHSSTDQHGGSPLCSALLCLWLAPTQCSDQTKECKPTSNSQTVWQCHPMLPWLVR